MRNKIFLFSDGIQSGKTSTLIDWIKGKNNVCGVLTPDVAEIRMLYDIEQNKYYPFETDVNEIEQVEVIGRFIFLKSAFEKAIEILNHAITKKPDWLIIDEIGKLQVEKKGLEPNLSSVLNDFSIHTPETKVIIVVRDFLLEKAIEKYGFKDAEILNASYFKK
jgi:nucleoside-triphosphatase THEP1